MGFGVRVIPPAWGSVPSSVCLKVSWGWQDFLELWIDSPLPPSGSACLQTGFCLGALLSWDQVLPSSPGGGHPRPPTRLVHVGPHTSSKAMSPCSAGGRWRGRCEQSTLVALSLSPLLGGWVSWGLGRPLPSGVGSCPRASSCDACPHVGPVQQRRVRYPPSVNVRGGASAGKWRDSRFRNLLPTSRLRRQLSVTSESPAARGSWAGCPRRPRAPSLDLVSPAGPAALTAGRGVCLFS